jgi:ATPase subunit of ABC transporter with duplicated ATPase domains
MELFKSLGPRKLIISFRRNNFEDWCVSGLGTRSIDYFKKIKNKEEVAMRLEELLPDLTSRLLWRPDLTKDFKLLKNCSIGERGTALLSIILIAGAEPLIIDQPEDDLDHFYLYKTLTPIIKEVKKRRQLIFATHDANIVVNGDAELIFIVITEDGEFGDITPTSIENLATREKVMDVLEGGKTAFIKREKKYGLK